MHIQIHPYYQPETRLPEHKATGYAFTNIRFKWGDLESSWPKNEICLELVNAKYAYKRQCCGFFEYHRFWHGVPFLCHIRHISKRLRLHEVAMSSRKRAADVVRFGVRGSNNSRIACCSAKDLHHCACSYWKWYWRQRSPKWQPPWHIMKLEMQWDKCGLLI